LHTLNLGILAHVDAGKTSLTERLLFTAGAIPELGSVDAGTTRTDSMDVERRRGITVRTNVASFATGDVQVNLIDTPGHCDFIAAVERSLAALREDAAHPERNLMDALIACARARASEGEIIESLQQVFGDYSETPVF